jgi:exopolysaccharide biosynthesis protein
MTARIALALLTLLLTPGLFAEDEWETVGPGVSYRHFNGDGRSIHVAKVDLTNDDIRVVATEESNRGKRVSDFAKRTQALIAINGDYYDMEMKPIGLAIGPCGQWEGTKDTSREGVIGFGDERITIRPQKEVLEKPQEWMTAAISGWPLLVRNCTPYSSSKLPGSDHFTRAPHPRTAVGMSRSGKTAYFVVAEGRSEQAKGLTLAELAEFMQEELGACTAMNLDGGGSSAMWVGDRIVNRLSDGSERRVANHLAVVLRSEDEGCPQKQGPQAKGER